MRIAVMLPSGLIKQENGMEHLYSMACVGFIVLSFIAVRVIGGDNFAEKVLANQDSRKARCRLDDCIEAVCGFYELQPSDLSKHGRMRKPSEACAVVAWLIRQYGSETLSDVARRFGRDVATMSTAVRRIEEKSLESDTIRNRLVEIENQIISQSDRIGTAKSLSPKGIVVSPS